MSTSNTPNRSINAYLFFDGRCEEALEFYSKQLGAEVIMKMRFQDGPPGSAENCPGGNPVPKDKIMHASFSIAGNIILASDGNSTGKPKFEGFSLSYTVPNAAEAEKVFNALAEGGKVEMPLTTTFFSPKFGMVADKFGVGWMVYVTPEQK